MKGQVKWLTIHKCFQEFRLESKSNTAFQVVPVETFQHHANGTSKKASQWECFKRKSVFPGFGGFVFQQINPNCWNFKRNYRQKFISPKFLFGKKIGFQTKMVNNPRHVLLYIQILRTDLHTFPLRLVERIWLKIKAFSVWRSFYSFIDMVTIGWQRVKSHTAIYLPCKCYYLLATAAKGLDSVPNLLNITM